MTTTETTPPDSSRPRPNPDPRFRAGADIHAHVLPGIDDGAGDMETSLLMLRRAARFGTALIAATPHRFYGSHENTPERIRRLTAGVNTALAGTKMSGRIRVLPGQEIPLSRGTASELRSGGVMTYGDNGRYALVEPPFDALPDWTGEALREIVRAGFQPVLAHPERNADLMRQPGRVEELVEAGALIQLTAMSVQGLNGPPAEDAAHEMLGRGLAHAVASDCHSPHWRPPGLRAVHRVLSERYGAETARRLCADNPRAVLLGEDLPRP